MCNFSVPSTGNGRSFTLQGRPHRAKTPCTPDLVQPRMAVSEGSCGQGPGPPGTPRSCAHLHCWPRSLHLAVSLLGNWEDTLLWLNTQYFSSPSQSLFEVPQAPASSSGRSLSFRVPLAVCSDGSDPRLVLFSRGGDGTRKLALLKSITDSAFVKQTKPV